MISKKLTIAVLSTFIIAIAYQVLAAYMTSPEGFNYPNPGHYPGQIGPGTFNCSGETGSNCSWSFPGDVYIDGNLNITGNLSVDTITASRICIRGDECMSTWDDLFAIITN
jgi:hypothetical protein